LGEIVGSLRLALYPGLIGLSTFCFLAANARGDGEATFNILKLAGNHVRWERPAGSPGLFVTYGLVSTPVESPGARNCRRMVSLDNLLAASKLSPAAVETELAAAFAMWEGAANIRFRAASAGEHPNILVGAQADPEGWAFADVFYETASPERIKPITQSLVCLNPTKRWKIGFDGDLTVYDLRYTFAHEIGHAIGLDHPTGAGQIMGYRYEEHFRSLQNGDRMGAVVLYGERTPGDGQIAAGVVARDPQPPSATRAIASPPHQ
jgi:hypothetical protein